MKTSLERKLRKITPKERRFLTLDFSEKTQINISKNTYFSILSKRPEGSFKMIALKGNISSKGNLSLKNKICIKLNFLNKQKNPIEAETLSGLQQDKRIGFYTPIGLEEGTSQFIHNFEVPSNTETIEIDFFNFTKEKLHIEVSLHPQCKEAVKKNLKDFSKNLEKSKSEDFFFIFSGTTYIQDIRANRPIRLAKEFSKRKIPVLFSYHRFLKTEEIPSYTTRETIIQIPIDITQDLIDEIIGLAPKKKNRILMISYPHALMAKTLFRFKINGWKVLYDARDDWEEFQKVGKASWYKKEYESYIVKNSDIVTSVSEPLTNKLKKIDHSSHISTVPNALSTKFLSPDYKKKEISQVIIGYFGHLSPSWFDWSALAEIAKRKKNYQFQIVGYKPEIKEQLPPNIELLGPKTPKEINKIASQWKVGIIPFKMGKLADAVDPIKIYEYLALELPVVSFRMPQIDNYPYTHTVESIEEFCDSLDQAIKIKINKAQLNLWLQENSWEKRTNKFLDLSKQIPIDKYEGLGKKYEGSLSL